MTPYRMQETAREEMAAADPFAGEGLFLPAPGVTSDVIIALVITRLGRGVQVVAWGDIGAWVAPGSSGMNAATIRDLWNGGRASEHE